MDRSKIVRNILDGLVTNPQKKRERTCMSPRIYRGRTAGRFCLGLAALGCVFAGVAAANAQAPVITNPGDLRTLSVNTAFRPGDPDPAWKVMAPMPTARAGFATAAANGKVYAMGGAVLNDCTTVLTVEAYDPVRDVWITELAPMPPPARYRPAGGTLDNIIYVVGGATTDICLQRHGPRYSPGIRPRDRQLVRQAIPADRLGFKLVSASIA